MNERPRTLEVTVGDGSWSDQRGQSDVLAIVALFGMVAVGAMAVIVTGGFLVDSVQGSSQHEVAKDSAIETHEAIAEALQSGETRNLATSNDLDAEVVESGNISIEMRDGSNVCSADVASVEQVETGLGAIVYSTPKGAVVYQGGAVWEETEAGLTTERTPPISYDNESARVSIQTVTAEADTYEAGTVQPNESMQTAKIQETNDLLTQCPANGYTDLQINVTSPNYASLWNDHFEARVNTSSNVDVDRTGDTVSATITNATQAHTSRGLRFTNISAPDVVGNRTGLPDQLDVDANVSNDGFATREAHTRVLVETPDPDDGPIVASSGTEEIPPAEDDWINLSDPSLSYSQLRSHPGITPGQQYDYTVQLVDSNGNNVSEASGKFFLAEPSGGALTMAPPSHTLGPAHDTLTVNATLINTLTTEEDTDVTFNFTDERIDTSRTVDVDVAGYGGLTEVSFGPMNVENLPAGLYEYEIEGANDTIPGTVAISNRSQPNLAGTLLLNSLDAPTMVESGSESLVVTTDVANLGDAPADGTLAVDIEGIPVVDGTTGTIRERSERTRQFSIPESELSALEVGEVHNYTVTLHGDGGSTDEIDGSFYLGHEGAVPTVESTSADGDAAVINTTVANDGLANVSETATLTLYDQDGSELGERETSPYQLGPGESLPLQFDLNASGLSGTYDYDVEFGGEVVPGQINFSGVSGGNDDVTITAPGNGTVTVLGTEVSGLTFWGSKNWAPVSVASTLTIDGDRSRHQFYNNATDDPESLYDMRNLNSYDTQEETYSYDWTQVEGETARLTVSSTLWQRQTDGFEHVGGGNYHPPESAWDGDPYNAVNANESTNSSNVRVLLDGDQVPNVHAAGPEQRSAAEILNQGAADRVTDDGTLDLGPNEAIFLVELSKENADWDRAHRTSGDPDYNDVIALVGFNPDEPGSVDFSVSDGSNLVIGPTNPDAGSDDGSQSVGGITPTVDEDGSSGPSAPDAESPDPGSPSEPDEIDVDVGGVVVG